MTGPYDAYEDQAALDDDRPNDAEGAIRQAIDLVSTAKSMPLSASAIVSREELLELLDDALALLPEELRQARWLLRDREVFIEEKQREADALLEDVRVQAERMVAKTEVVRQAQATAEQIIADAREEARRLRHEADDYCDQKLAGMEIVLDRIMKTVQSGREKLQPVVDAGAQPLSEELADGADDSFFDQDLA